MKKIASLLIVLTCISSLLLLSFSSAAQCTNGIPTISIDQVRTYMRNYRKLVLIHGTHAAWQLVSLSSDAMACLSTNVDSVKIIAASLSATRISTLTTIVELCKNGNCLFYDTNVLFPTGQVKTKIPARTCPPPSNCGIPLYEEFNKKIDKK